MPKISIIMPVYNSINFLDEAIRSILNQTFSDWEFIIINEFGSNDGSKEMIEHYAKIDKRFILIQNKTKLGISGSMNAGLLIAQGEYIARMDADDISLSKRFEKQVNYMDMHPDIAMCGVKVEIFGSNSFEWELETDSEKLATNVLFYSPSVHPTVMMRKSFLDQYNLNYNKNYKASEDYDLFSRICQFGKIANIDEVLFRYRIMENNATFKNNNIGYLIYNEVMQEQFGRLNITFTENELLLLSPHYSLKGAKGKEVLLKLVQLDLLLKKILIANDKEKIYKVDYLMMTLHKRFKEAHDSISWACSGVDFKKTDELYTKSVFSKEIFYHSDNIIISNPMVSVLLPTYNSEKYILDTIWSVLEQSYSNFEVLILNEFGSNDETVRIAEMFHDPRIRIIQNSTKLGLAESLNKGMKEAKGKYIARMDADDLCHKDRFKLQVEFLENNPEHGVCGSWQHHFGIETDWIHKCSVRHEDIEAELLYNCDLCHSTLMLRRKFFIENNLFYDNCYAAEDYELWTRAVRIFKFANLPRVLGEYRVGEDNITVKKMDKLSQESGKLVAKNLKYYFGIEALENHILMLSGWRNEISRLSNKDRQVALQNEKGLLYKIWKSNKSKRIFEEQSLLKTINRRWRTVTCNWQEDDQVFELKELFKRYRYDSVRTVYVHSSKKQLFKKVIKKVLGIIYKPIRYRTMDVLQKQLWDLDGHLSDVERQLRDLNSHLSDTEKSFNRYTHENVNQIIKEVDKYFRENAFIRTVTDDINRSLDKYFEIVEDTLIKEEENTIKQVNEIVAKSEKDIIRVLDNRLWKGEQQIQQTFDGRIWEAETIIRNKMERFSKIEKYRTGEKNDFLLINDTFNTFHFGCTATSLAIRSQLQKRGSVRFVSWDVIRDPQIVPSNCEEFVSYEFLQKWVDEYYWLVEMIHQCKHIVINGEGSMSRYHAGTLFLLYVIYYSAVHAKKQVSVINHSIYPVVEADGLDRQTQKDFILMIQSAYIHLNRCCVREHLSLQSLNQWLPNVGIQSFDCLPLYIRDYYPYYQKDTDRQGLVISGGNNLPIWYVDFIERLLLEIDFKNVSFLFSDICYSEHSADMSLYNCLKERLGDCITLLAVKTVNEWLHSIHSASLFVSGRFHHTIASYILDTPFMAFNTDTNKMKGMLEMIKTDDRLLNSKDLEGALHQALKLWKDMQQPINRDSCIKKEEIISLAEKNFEFN